MSVATGQRTRSGERGDEGFSRGARADAGADADRIDMAAVRRADGGQGVRGTSTMQDEWEMGATAGQQVLRQQCQVNFIAAASDTPGDGMMKGKLTYP